MQKVLGYIKDYLSRMDKLLMVFCLAVSGISLVLLYGILQTGYANSLSMSSRNLIVQGGAVIVGTVGVIALSLIDYHVIMKAWVIHVPLCYLLVLLTFWIGVGVAARMDDTRWLVVPVLDIWFQPAEVLKVSFILVFASHISKFSETMNKPLHCLTLLLHTMVPVALVYLQGDAGNALLILLIAVIMLFSAGISWRYVIVAAVGTAAMLPVLWRSILSDFHRDRILTLINQETADPLGLYFQQFRAKIAIANGGITGIGLLGPGHTYVPEMQTDFIFAFLCESFGFMGALGMLALMIALCMKLLYNAHCARDMYGSLICVGVFGMYSCQFLINVGMCLSLMPVVGNTFPFLSYGGSSMLSSFLGIGLVMPVYMQRRRTTLFTE